MIEEILKSKTDTDIILYVDKLNKHIFYDLQIRLLGEIIIKPDDDCFVVYVDVKNNKIQWDNVIPVSDISKCQYLY